LQTGGFDLEKLRFWITETGTYSGEPTEEGHEMPYQTESQQAEGLIKRYTVAFGEGIEKVLWAWGIKRRFWLRLLYFRLYRTYL